MSIRATIQRERVLLRFHRDRLKRNWRYRGPEFSARAYPEVLSALRADGFAILKGAVAEERVLAVRDELEGCLSSGRHLNTPSRDSARSAGDLSGASAYLTAQELDRGEGYYRQHTNYISVSEPLVNCPSVAGLTFDEMLIDIAAGYLGGFPAVGGLNLRKSFANGLAEYDTLHFHCDGNSPRFVKFFFYLNDVDERGGPFCYVRGSHRDKFGGWDGKYRWLPAEIESIYGEERVVYLTAGVGDMLVADTTGFHRGTKVLGHDRSMLTVNYVLHPEYWNPAPQFKLAADAYGRLTPKQRAAADFLEVGGG